MFQFSDQGYYMMPGHFGGWPAAPGPARYRDVTQIMITYETDAAALRRYVPATFTPAAPVLVVGYSMCRQVDWLAGGGYNLIQVSTPVSYEKDGERIDGVYPLVIWENRTAPILTGREQTGMPKIFADIGDHRILGSTASVTASYEGATFLRMDLERETPLPPAELAALGRRMGVANAFGWRHIPNIGRPGAALSHPTLFPQEATYAEAWRGAGRLRWEALGPLDYPVHGVITEALAALPVRAYGECLMTRGGIVLRNDLARQLD